MKEIGYVYLIFIDDESTIVMFLMLMRVLDAFPSTSGRIVIIFCSSLGS